MPAPPHVQDRRHGAREDDDEDDDVVEDEDGDDEDEYIKDAAPPPPSGASSSFEVAYSAELRALFKEVTAWDASARQETTLYRCSACFRLVCDQHILSHAAIHAKNEVWKQAIESCGEDRIQGEQDVVDAEAREALQEELARVKIQKQKLDEKLAATKTLKQEVEAELTATKALKQTLEAELAAANAKLAAAEENPKRCTEADGPDRDEQAAKRLKPASTASGEEAMNGAAQLEATSSSLTSLTTGFVAVASGVAALVLGVACASTASL